jgi:nucleoside-diphosphate-sugar epimerase
MTIAITGANGWIGRSCCFEARRRGLRVFAIDRRFDGDGPWDVSRAADITSGEFVTTAGLAKTDYVRAIIHCAGYAHRPLETPVDKALFEAVNHGGTRRALQLAQFAESPRFVYLSSIAFYDWRVSSCDSRTEDGLLHAETAYAISKLAGERACLDSNLDIRVARLATVFGTGDRANFAKLASALSRRRFVVPGRGGARKSVIPVTLVAELLVDLALKERVDYRVINLGLPSTPTLREICDAYCELCDFPWPPKAPRALLAGIAFGGDVVERWRGSFPLTSSTLRKLTTDTTVDVSRMQSVWPDRKWPDFRSALAESAAYYRTLR